MFKLHTLTQVHKLKKGIGPEYLLNKLKLRKDTHDHNTRHRNDFEITHAKKDLNKNRFFNKSLTDYNSSLTLETGRKLKSTGENEKLFYVKDWIITFKKKLRNYLLWYMCIWYHMKFNSYSMFVIDCKLSVDEIVIMLLPLKNNLMSFLTVNLC